MPIDSVAKSRRFVTQSKLGEIFPTPPAVRQRAVRKNTNCQNRESAAGFFIIGLPLVSTPYVRIQNRIFTLA